MPSRSDLEAKLRILASHAWDGEVLWPHIEAWLENFSGSILPQDKEQLCSLFVLSRFIYFGDNLVREMLRSLYRDHFEAPLIQRIRRNCCDTKDSALLRRLFNDELNATRFIGVGNPSESGAHLLYFFRQVNRLKKDLFVDIHGAFAPQTVTSRRVSDPKTVLYLAREANVSRYVFFDDLVGSGTQATRYLSTTLSKIRKSNNGIDLQFKCLFATTKGMERMNAPSMFDGKAVCLFELDDTFKAFSEHPRYFTNAPSWVVLRELYDIALHYGGQIQPDFPLGYKDGQLLLGFSYNTPDNTLPIFWNEGRTKPWSPVFVRYDKVYD